MAKKSNKNIAYNIRNGVNAKTGDPIVLFTCLVGDKEKDYTLMPTFTFDGVRYDLKPFETRDMDRVQEHANALAQMRISEALAWTQERKDAVSAEEKAKWTDEKRAEASEREKANWSDERRAEEKAKWTPEMRAKVSELQKAKWTPEKRAEEKAKWTAEMRADAKAKAVASFSMSIPE